MSWFASSGIVVVRRVVAVFPFVSWVRWGTAVASESSSSSSAAAAAAVVASTLFLFRCHGSGFVGARMRADQHRNPLTDMVRDARSREVLSALTRRKVQARFARGPRTAGGACVAVGRRDVATLLLVVLVVLLLVRDVVVQRRVGLEVLRSPRGALVVARPWGLIEVAEGGLVERGEVAPLPC